MTETPSQIYISYSHGDKPWVSEFVSALRAGGVDPWYADAELAPGDRWADKVQDALRKSDTLIVVLSPRHLTSPWVSFELGAAIADKKRIVPVLTENLDIGQIPAPLRLYQMLRAKSPQEAGQRVAEALESRTRDHKAPSTSAGSNKVNG